MSSQISTGSQLQLRNMFIFRCRHASRGGLPLGGPDSEQDQPEPFQGPCCGPSQLSCVGHKHLCGFHFIDVQTESLAKSHACQGYGTCHGKLGPSILTPKPLPFPIPQNICLWKIFSVDLSLEVISQRKQSKNKICFQQTKAATTKRPTSKI